MIDKKHIGKMPVALPTASKIMPRPVVWVEAPWARKIREGRAKMFGASADSIAPPTITPVAVPVTTSTNTETAPVASTTTPPAVFTPPPTSAPAIAKSVVAAGPNITYNPNVATLNPAIVPIFVQQQDQVKSPTSSGGPSGGGGGGGFMDEPSQSPSGGVRHSKDIGLWWKK